MSTIPICVFASTPDIHERGFLVQVLTGSPEELAEQSLARGYDGFEFMPNPERVPDPSLFVRAIEKTGAVLPVVNSGRLVRTGWTLFSADRAIASRARDSFKEMLAFAGAVGASVGLGIARGPTQKDLASHEMDSLAEDLFCELAEYAELVGTTILFEPAESEITDFALTVAEVMTWVERIGSPAFRLMLDTQQLVDNESSLTEGIRAAQKEALHIHLFDRGRTPPRSIEDGLDWDLVFNLLGEHDCFPKTEQGSASVSLSTKDEGKYSDQETADFLRAQFHRVLSEVHAHA